MSREKYNPGDSVFLIEGNQVEYVAACGAGHIVRGIYDRDDEEPGYGRPFEVPEVFSKPPVAKHDEATKLAVERLSELRGEISKASAKLYEIKRDRDQAVKTIGQHPDLVPLSEWLRGEITHVVLLPIYGGTIRIKELKDAVTPEDRSDAANGHVRLLSLCGGRKYNDSLSWQLSAYSDGSDSKWQHCLLATSEDNAKQRLQLWVDKEMRRNDSHVRLDIAESAISLGLTVPENIAKQVQERSVKHRATTAEQLRRNIASYEATLARDRAALDAIETTP